MDHSLSLRMTIRRLVELTTLFSASRVMPQVKAASPQTRHDVLVGAAEIASRRHAEGRAQRGARVAGAIGVVRAFGAVEKPARAAGLAQFSEKFAAAAGEEFVHVALVGDVEDELVRRAC